MYPTNLDFMAAAAEQRRVEDSVVVDLKAAAMMCKKHDSSARAQAGVVAVNVYVRYFKGVRMVFWSGKEHIGPILSFMHEDDVRAYMGIVVRQERGLLGGA
jgi:hypothetical protein